MKRFLLLLAASLGCVPLAAAEPTADDYLNFFRPTIGQWAVEGKMGAKTAKGVFSSSLSSTGRCIVSSTSKLFQYPAIQGLEGYDPESKRWKWSGFNAAGEHWVSYVSADAESLRGKEATFKLECSVVKPNGKKDAWRGDIKVTIGKDQWTQAFVNQALNGEKQPDEDYVYQRRGKAAAAPGEAASGEAVFKSYAEFVIGGVWTSTGDQRKVEDSYRWLPGNQFVELAGKGGILPYTGIIGVDPETKRCTWWCFNDEGSIGKAMLTPQGDGVWVLDGKGTGTKGPIRYKGRLSRVDENTLKEEVIEFVFHGEKQKGGTFTWTRKR